MTTTLTLATLPEATAQQVFDHVARHLLKQGAPSMASDGAGCRYRGDKGRACAAAGGDDEHGKMILEALDGHFDPHLLDEDEIDFMLEAQGIHYVEELMQALQAEIDRNKKK